MEGKPLTKALTIFSLIPLLARAADLGSFDSSAQESSNGNQEESMASVEQSTLASHTTTSSYDLSISAVSVSAPTTSQYAAESQLMFASSLTTQTTLSTQTTEGIYPSVSTQDTISNNILSASTTTRNWDTPLTTLTTTNSAGETYTSEIWWLPSTSLTTSTVTGSSLDSASTTGSSSTSGSSTSSGTTASIHQNSTNAANYQSPPVLLAGAALALLI